MPTFRAILTGLCAFIPDREFGNLAVPPKKIMTIMVDARRTQKNLGTTALDGRGLRYHNPVLGYFPGDLMGGDGLGLKIPEKLEELWSFYYLSHGKAAPARWEITLEIGELSNKLTNPFKVVQEGLRDFNHGIHVRQFMDSALQMVNPYVFADGDNSVGLVSARVLLDRGELSTYQLDDSITWSMASTLGRSFDGVPLSNLAALEIRDVAYVKLKGRNIDGGDDFVFQFRGDRDVEMLLGNLCCESLEPRNIPFVLDDNRKRRDKDFRWFYELLDAKGAVQDRLRGVSLPVPVPRGVKAQTGLKPVQCMRLNMPAMTFGED
jgi:hypothetical protein